MLNNALFMLFQAISKSITVTKRYKEIENTIDFQVMRNKIELIFIKTQGKSKSLA